MADRVQYVMDRMAGSFREMEQLGVFSHEEVRSVVKRRTDFEYRLRRRQQTPADYLSYLQYELGLEELRDMRCKKQRGAEGDTSTQSKELLHKQRKLQASFMKHISYVFERALRRFPDDMNMWNDYISFLQDKKANSILNTVFGRALCLHPKNENIWLQAAKFEISENSNAHAARVLLQRAIRINKLSEKLWKTYFELELWYLARADERRRILGLKSELEADDDTKNYEQQLGAPWVVYRHATKQISGLDFCIQLLKSTGSGCSFSCRNNNVTSLQKEIKADLLERFGDSPKYWVATLYTCIEEHFSFLEESLRSVSKTHKKKRSIEEVNSNRNFTEMEQNEDSTLVLMKLNVLSSGLEDCFTLLEMCKSHLPDEDIPSTSFFSACVYDFLSKLSPGLHVPASTEVSLSSLDLFRSQKTENGSNVIQEICSMLTKVDDFLDQDFNDPFFLAAKLFTTNLSSILSSQYPDILPEANGMSSSQNLENILSRVLVWLKINTLDSVTINIWSILADLSFHSYSILNAVGSENNALLLCNLVLSQGPLLLNVPTNCGLPSVKLDFLKTLSSDLTSDELKSKLLSQAIEYMLLRDDSLTSAMRSVEQAMEAALLGRKPQTVTLSSDPSPSDASYVNWLLYYTNMALMQKGTEGFKQACSFVETRCFSEKPHCITATLSLHRYYEQVVNQGMNFLRASSISYSGEKLDDDKSLEIFVKNLIEQAIMRCSSGSDPESVSIFLEAKEDMERISGHYEQANHTRWKRTRAL